MSPFDSFRTARWIRTFNLVLQAVLFLTLFGGLNYLARNHPSRYDLTARHRYSLSPETKAYLGNLAQPTRVVVTITPDSENPGNLQAYRDVSGLLREYAYETENSPNGRITVEYLDVYKNRHKAEEYGIESPEIVVVICGEKRRALTVDDLYSMKDKQREAFQGEQALTGTVAGFAQAPGEFGELALFFLKLDRFCREVVRRRFDQGAESVIALREFPQGGGLLEVSERLRKAVALRVRR